MVSSKFVAISYCFAFLGIYLISIAYALISGFVNKSYNTKLPQTTAMNSTVSAISSFSSWSGTLMIVGILISILAILFIILSSRAMSSAI